MVESGFMARPVLASLLLFGCRANTPVQAPDPAPISASAPQDHDGDGFLDPQDACPEAAGIAPDGCPKPDRDGDGILGSDDRCPDDGGVEPDGCPVPDTDGDAILDPDDKCLAEPETKNGYLDEDGCPDSIPEDLAKITGIIRGISFDAVTLTLKPKSQPVLDHAVQVLKMYPGVRIEISGHSDSTVNPDYSNPWTRRARAVGRYLIEHGINETRIEILVVGPDFPLDTNKTARGRARNRRIEFSILVP